MKLKNLLILCVSVLFLTLSCSDEDYITPGELVAIELNEAISQHYIRQVICYVGENNLQHRYSENAHFYIEGAFFHIQTHTYNLEKLIMHNISVSEGRTTLTLYF